MVELVLIGAGTMGNAMLARWLDSDTLSPADVFLVEKDDDKRKVVEERYGVRSAPSLDQAEAGQFYVIAVKPQDSRPVLESLSGMVNGATVISIMAGVTIGSLRKTLSAPPSIVRVMPNIAATVGAAAMAYATDQGPGELDEARVVELLSAVGEPVEVAESLLDAVTAVSGSGPAYFFLLAEALTEAGVSLGLSPDVSRSLARQTMWGSARLLEESGREAEDLRASVTSKGGTTHEAIKVLESLAFKDIVGNAVNAARDRARELSNETN